MTHKLLDIDELNKVEKPMSRERNIRIYEEFLKQCHNKIKEYNKVHRIKFCYYQPPSLVLGKTLYNYFDLLDYLMENLSANGMYVEMTQQGIFISWDPSLINKEKYLSVLKQNAESQEEAIQTHSKTAMDSIKKEMPEPPKPKPKKSVKIIDKPISVVCLDDDAIPVNVEWSRYKKQRQI